MLLMKKKCVPMYICIYICTVCMKKIRYGRKNDERELGKWSKCKCSNRSMEVLLSAILEHYGRQTDQPSNRRTLRVMCKLHANNIKNLNFFLVPLHSVFSVGTRKLRIDTVIDKISYNSSKER